MSVGRARSAESGPDCCPYHYSQARLAQIYRTPVRKVKTLSGVERKLWAHHVIAQAKRARTPHAAVASPAARSSPPHAPSDNTALPPHTRDGPTAAAGSVAKTAPARARGRHARGKRQEAPAHRQGPGRGVVSASRAEVDRTPVDQVLLSPECCVCARACADMRALAQVHLLPVRQQRMWARHVLRLARSKGARDSARAPSKLRASAWKKWAYVESPAPGGCGGACQ